MSRNGVRGAIIAIHRWAGLVIGLLWAVQGLTGALMVFQPELERLEQGWEAPAPMASLDQLVNAAEARAGAPVRRLAMPNRDVAVIEADFTGAGQRREIVSLDAAAGRVRAVSAAAPGLSTPSDFWGWVHSIHERALLGKSGGGLIALSGLLLISAVLMGLWLGWPRRGQWKAAFSIRRWRSPPQRRYGWHRAVGLAAGAALVVVAGAGVYMASLSVFQKPSRPAVRLLGSAVGPQQAVDIALRRFPAAAFSSVTLPTDLKPAYGVRLTQPGEARRRSGRTSVEVDARTGRVGKVYDPLHAGLADRLSDVVLPLHYGEIAGLLGRILVAAAGLSLPPLYVLGVSAWLTRRRIKRKII